MFLELHTLQLHQKNSTPSMLVIPETSMDIISFAGIQYNFVDRYNPNTP